MKKISTTELKITLKGKAIEINTPLNDQYVISAFQNSQSHNTCCL